MDSDRVTTEKVAKLSEAVRNKIKMFKKDLADQREAIERQVAPLKEPLQTIASEFVPKKKVKVETKVETDRKENYTSESKQDVGKTESLSLNEFYRFISDEKDSDRIYGLRYDGSKYWIGDSQAHIDNKYLIIGEKKYLLTLGLIQLLTRKVPLDYDNGDLTVYKEILLQTNAHKKTYSFDKPINSNRGYKYTNIIGPLFFSTGKGLSFSLNDSNNTVIDMLDRLELLWASEEAGNSHGEETEHILNNLRKLGVIY